MIIVIARGVIVDNRVLSWVKMCIFALWVRWGVASPDTKAIEWRPLLPTYGIGKGDDLSYDNSQVFSLLLNFDY